MAFDYGSIDLGLKNPFKKEGLITALRGGVQTALALYLLISAAAVVKQDAGTGWILVIFGVYMLARGLQTLGSGIYATMRYFVGRNHPTSLAQNHSRSEASTSAEETSYVAYKGQDLEEMLVGRKNATFKEPQGFLARLIHSFLPKLLFMPYPIRNMSQRLFGAWVKTVVALVAYGFVAFVSLAGFAGDEGELIFPIYSILLMTYLLLVWREAGRAINRDAERRIESLGTQDLVRVSVFSLVAPVLIGLGISTLLSKSSLSKLDIENWIATIPSLNTPLYLLAVIIIAGLATSLLLFMLNKRLAHADPVVEVSELRENWQESVHPDEIFINLDNLVMANRRYKEVPNRVYKELVPKLNEQVEGKGGFAGEMIQEVQPKVKPMVLGENFNKARLASLISGNLLFIVAMLLTLALAYAAVDIYVFVKSLGEVSLKSIISGEHFGDFASLCMSALHLFLIGFIFRSFGSLLSNAAHVYFAEIQFESLLVYFKCEGTFTESKISTGTGIHDSTRSENTLVRSSITPWVIVSKIISTTFAATGIRNLEHPRHILQMSKSESDLHSIRNDVIGFLKDRESIASITSERDLGNASQIHQLNQQTRAIPSQQTLGHDEEAAGYIAQEEDLKEKQDPTSQP